MKGKTAQSEAKEAPSNGKTMKLPIPFEIGIIKKVLDGKDVRKSKGDKLNYAKGGKMGCYAAGGAIATAKGMGAAIKGGKFHEA